MISTPHFTPPHYTARHTTPQHNILMKEETETTESTITRQPPPGPSPKTLAIIKRLEAAKDGEIVTYKELDALAGGSIQTKYRGHLSTARKRLLAEQGKFFVVEFNVGVRLGTKQDMEDHAEAIPGHISRCVKKGAKILAAVKYEELTREEQLQHNVTASRLGAISLFASRKGMGKVKQAVISGGAVVDQSRMLALFSNGK